MALNSQWQCRALQLPCGAVEQHVLSCPVDRRLPDLLIDVSGGIGTTPYSVHSESVRAVVVRMTWPTFPAAFPDSDSSAHPQKGHRRASRNSQQGLKGSKILSLAALFGCKWHPGGPERQWALNQFDPGAAQAGDKAAWPEEDFQAQRNL